MPEQGVIFAQCHKEDGPDAAERDPAGAGHWIVDFRQIGAVRDALSCEQGSARVIGPRNVTPPQSLRHFFRETAHRDAVELLAIPELQAATRGAAQRVGLLDDRLEDRFEIAGRSVDDL